MKTRRQFLGLFAAVAALSIVPKPEPTSSFAGDCKTCHGPLHRECIRRYVRCPGHDLGPNRGFILHGRPGQKISVSGVEVHRTRPTVHVDKLSDWAMKVHKEVIKRELSRSRLVLSVEKGAG